MKKFIAIALALTTSLSLLACQGNGSAAAVNDSTEAVETKEEETKEASEEAVKEESQEAETESKEETEAAKEEGSENAGKFIMGIDPEYPPFSYIGDDGEYTGFDVEVCKAVCEKLGYDFDVFEVNWDEKLIQLDAGECDCIWSGMTIYDTMKEAGYVISEPYFENVQVMMVKEDSGINSTKDLAGKYVAVQLGTSGAALLEDELKDLASSFGDLVTCDSFLKCFTELGGGAVDAVFVDKPVAVDYMAEHEGYKLLEEDLGSEQYGIAFRSDDKELCSSIEGALDEMVADGSYAAIADKYPDLVKNLVYLNK
ncbi:MAG: transporter substrate-binding domain-containing protein [Lachnospiraceae bacterium]|nr:transporter substrate-binding domain-containing protein [Lachnospiraceae bacterium]